MTITKFPTAPAIPVIGQPVTLLAVYIPVTATLQCNCGGAHAPLEIVNSVAVPCPSCGNVYNVAFNPAENKLQVTGIKPKIEVPS